MGPELKEEILVKIRLKRCGSLNRPQWRIVVTDIRMPRDGRFIEEIGYYEPLSKDEKIVVKNDRLEHWRKNGAQITPTVKSLLKRMEKKAKKTASA